MTTEMNPKQSGPLSKYDRRNFLGKPPRVTAGIRAKILRTYEKGLRERNISDDLLVKLGEQYNRSTRQIQRYIQQARSERIKDEKPNVYVVEQAPVIAEVRERHFGDLCQVIRQWKEQLVFEVTGFLGKYDTAFPTHFGSEDARLDSASGNYREKGPLRWYIDRDGAVDVWFSIEELALFRCLRPHLPNQELWQSFEELKKKLAESIEKAALTHERRGAFVHGALSLASVVANELEIALAKRWLAGKCEACPEVSQTK